MQSCENCTTPMCGECLRGGPPVRKEVLTVVALFFFITTIVLGILLMNAKKGGSSKPISLPMRTIGTKQAKLPIARSYASTITLPAPKLRGTISVEQAIATRRSRREFADTPLTLAQLSQILWSA